MFLFLLGGVWKWLEVALVVFATIPFLITYHRSSSEYENAINIFIWMSLGVIWIEVVVKIAVMRKEVFKIPSIFGELVTAILETGSRAIKDPHDKSNIIFLIFMNIRIARLLKVCTVVRGSDIVIGTFKKAIAPIFNVALVIFILIIMYSIFGMIIFPFQKERDGIGANANFQNFGISFQTLWRMATVDAWNELMFDCLRQLEPNDICFPINSYEDFKLWGMMACGSPVAYLFFMSYVVIVNFMLMNLITALVIDSYMIEKRLQGTKVNKKHFTAFVTEWVRWDKDQEYVLAINRIPKILRKMGAPLSIPEAHRSDEMISKLLKNLKIPVYRRYTKDKGPILVYHFYDVLLGLTKNSLKGAKRYAERGLDFKVKINEDLFEKRQELLKRYDDLERLEFSSLHVECWGWIKRGIYNYLSLK